MQQNQSTTEWGAPTFSQKEFEAACFHSLGLLEQNREYLEQHLLAQGADKNTMQALADMQTACVRLERTIDEIAAAIACLRGTAQPSSHAFDMGGFVRALASQQEPIRRELGIELIIDGPAEGDPFVLYGDSEWAEQICLHLLSNALHACDKGGHVWLTLSRRQDKIALSVADDGCGLPDGTERSQLENRRHFLGGARLGLALCREYCARMGWELELCNRSAAGAQAVVTAPSQRAEALPDEVVLCQESEQEQKRRAQSMSRFLAGEVAGMEAATMIAGHQEHSMRL